MFYYLAEPNMQGYNYAIIAVLCFCKVTTMLLLQSFVRDVEDWA